MAKKKQASDGAAGADDSKKPATVKLASVVLCVGLASGGYMMGGRGASASPAGPEAAPTTTISNEDGCEHHAEEEGPGHVVDLPAMSINLAASHYLRIAVSLGLCHGAGASEGDGHGGGEEGPTIVMAPAQDIIVETLSGASMAELATEAGRGEAKQTLTEHVREVYPGIVAELYFIEFVMQ